MFDIHISSDATVTGWRLLGEIEVFVTALAGSRLPAAMVEIVSLQCETCPFSYIGGIKAKFVFFPCSASSR